MSMHRDVALGDELIIYNKTAKIGPIRARSTQDKQDRAGTLAHLEVDLYSSELWISHMRINTNGWDVYLADSFEGREFLLNHYLPLPQH